MGLADTVLLPRKSLGLLVRLMKARDALFLVVIMVTRTMTLKRGMRTVAPSSPSRIFAAPPASRKMRPAPKDDGRDESGAIRFVHKAVVGLNSSLGLLEFVLTSFPVKRTQAKQWLAHGAILVNDEVQSKFDYEVFRGDVVLVARSSRTLSAKSSTSSSATSGQLNAASAIHFEDDEIIVVEKPSNLPLTVVAPASSKESSLLLQINGYLGKKKQKAYVVHQMDVGASGLVVFAKSISAKEFMQKNWSSFGRSFVCVCRDYLTPVQGVWTTYNDESDAMVRCYSSKSVDSALGDIKLHKAVTNYRTVQTATIQQDVDSSSVISLVELSLETNRRDQIRSQFANMNHSILGDDLYCSNTAPAMELFGRKRKLRLALHSSELRITHPITRETMTLRSPTPPSITNLLGTDEPGKFLINTSESGPNNNDRVVVIPLAEWLKK